MEKKYQSNDVVDYFYTFVTSATASAKELDRQQMSEEEWNKRMAEVSANTKLGYALVDEAQDRKQSGAYFSLSEIKDIVASVRSDFKTAYEAIMKSDKPDAYKQRVSLEYDTVVKQTDWLAANIESLIPATKPNIPFER